MLRDGRMEQAQRIGKKLSKDEVKAELDALCEDGGVEGALEAIERHFKWANNYSGYDAPKITINAKGELTNGKYTNNTKKCRNM